MGDFKSVKDISKHAMNPGNPYILSTQFRPDSDEVFAAFTNGRAPCAFAVPKAVGFLGG